MLGRAKQAQEDAEELARIVEAARAEVAAAFAAVRDRQVAAETEKRSVESIGDAADDQLPLDRLPENGFFTVADVLRAGAGQLAYTCDLGEGEAATVVAAAERVRQSVRDSLQFRIDLDPTDELTTRMLQALAVWGAVRHAGEAHEAQARRAGRRPGRATPAGRGGRGRTRCAGCSWRPAGRQAADDAAQQIRDLLERASANGLLRAAKDVRAVEVPSPDEVWRDFEQRSAAYYGLLAEVVELRRRRGGGRGVPAGRDRRADQRPAAGHLAAVRRAAAARLPVVRGPVRAGPAAGHPRRRDGAGQDGAGHRRRWPTSPPSGGTHFLVVCPASVLINWTREVAPALDAAGDRPARR